jgi:hypothetical protein
VQAGSAAHAELKQLRSAVATLRAELEQERALREDAVQRAASTAQQEIRQLKTTLGALHDALEQARYEAEPKVQQAVANSKEEIAELRATSAALRTALEREEIVHAQALEDLHTQVPGRGDPAAGHRARAARAARVERRRNARHPMSDGPAKSAERAQTEGQAATARTKRRREPRRSNDDARRLRLAELLLEVTRRVAKCESLDDVLHVIVELTAAELGAERGSLFLNDKASGELYARVAQGRINARSAW